MNTHTRNRWQCQKCGDIIESKSRHDFVQCKCGASFCDGGGDYCRIGGSPLPVPDSVPDPDKDNGMARATKKIRPKKKK